MPDPTDVDDAFVANIPGVTNVEQRLWTAQKEPEAETDEIERVKRIYANHIDDPHTRDNRAAKILLDTPTANIVANRAFRQQFAAQIQTLLYHEFGLRDTNTLLRTRLRDRLFHSGFGPQNTMTSYGPYKNICSILKNMDDFGREYEKEMMINAVDALMTYFLCQIRRLRGRENKVSTLADYHFIFDKIPTAAHYYKQDEPAYFVVTNVPAEFCVFERPSAQKVPTGAIGARGIFTPSASKNERTVTLQGNFGAAQRRLFEEDEGHDDAADQLSQSDEFSSDEEMLERAFIHGTTPGNLIRKLNNVQLEESKLPCPRGLIWEEEVIRMSPAQAEGRWTDNMERLDVIDGAGEDITTDDTEFLESTYTEAMIAAMKKTDRRQLMGIMQGLSNTAADHILQTCQNYRHCDAQPYEARKKGLKVIDTLWTDNPYRQLGHELAVLAGKTEQITPDILIRIAKSILLIGQDFTRRSQIIEAQNTAARAWCAAAIRQGIDIDVSDTILEWHETVPREEVPNLEIPQHLVHRPRSTYPKNVMKGVISADDIRGDEERQLFASMFGALAQFRYILPFRARETFDYLIDWIVKEPEVGSDGVNAMSTWTRREAQAALWERVIQAVPLPTTAQTIQWIENRGEDDTDRAHRDKDEAARKDEAANNEAKVERMRKRKKSETVDASDRPLHIASLRSIIDRIPCPHTREAGKAMVNDAFGVDDRDEAIIDQQGDKWQGHLLGYAGQGHRGGVSEFLSHDRPDTTIAASLLLHFMARANENEEVHKTATRLARNFVGTVLGVDEASAASAGAINLAEEVQTRELAKTKKTIRRKQKKNT